MLTRLDDVVRRAIARRTPRQPGFDHGVDDLDPRLAGADALQVGDRESALDADRLVGADDILDLFGPAERQQQTFERNLLAVAIRHPRNRISGAFPRQAGAIAGHDALIALRAGHVVEIAPGPVIETGVRD